MPAYTAPKLPPQKMAAVEQGLFDFLVPFRSLLLRPDQAAQCLRGEKNTTTLRGRVRADSRHHALSYVYALRQEGKLECIAPTGREKERFMVTRRSVLLLLAEQSNFEPSDFDTRLEALLPSLTRAQLDRLITKATRLREKL
jgi:hypothetical protein